MIARRLLIAAALLAPIAAFAQTAPVAPAALSAVSASQPIQALNDGLMLVMHAGRATPFADRLTMLTPVIRQSFDLPLILQNSVGPSKWSTISEAQKAALMDVFTQFTVASYVANFDAFAGETFAIGPDLRHVGRDVVVATRIIGPAGDVTKLDYVMRETNGGWHVVDILLDGSISRVAVTRSDFRALLGQGDASKLIESLRGKVASLASGNIP